MNAPSNVLFAQGPISTISHAVIDELKLRAEGSDLKRARFCMHLSTEDAIQEMVIVLCKETYVRPHRHIDKSESVHLIEGEMLVGIFDDAGEIEQVIHLSTDERKTFLYRMSNTKWHTVVPLTEYVVFHEVVMGPYQQSEFPAWEPYQNVQEIQSFKEKVMKAYSFEQTILVHA